MAEPEAETSAPKPRAKKAAAKPKAAAKKPAAKRKPAADAAPQLPGP